MDYDIIVIGGGHAGCEAAASAAKLGSKVLLITLDMNKIAQMSCNPAMGGIAKGQIVREIDALGGMSGIISDATFIQFRMLNRSKGPAMWSPRAQIDRVKFIEKWREALDQIENLDMWQDEVRSLIIEEGKVQGVETALGKKFFAPRVILTAGTFLGGLMHFGKTMLEGGRISEPASKGITQQLVDYGFTAGRMKTGTPARIDGRSVDWSLTTEQKGDEEPLRFSYLSDRNAPTLPQRSCHILYTDEHCHSILRDSLDASPLYNGQIDSVGPRYCPSIETKIVTFADKDAHQLFLEPEGLTTNEYYLNGFSSSLPIETQIKALRVLPALRNVKLYRPGYAIEYDYFDPTQLHHTLETKKIKGLYFAGQVNGTTGYEEAAAQGLVAGINAHLAEQGKEPFILQRDEAYIGVLIDDLVTKGVDEPYRMFTSRAEFRTLLRQDNADERLTPKAIELGLASEQRIEQFKKKQRLVQDFIEFASQLSVRPEWVNPALEEKGWQALKQGMRLREFILRTNITITFALDLIAPLRDYVSGIDDLREEILEAAEIAIKYAGYIEREKLQAEKMHRLEGIKLGNRFDYLALESLSTEARQKLDKIRPATIGQAARIPGVSPHDVSILIVLCQKES